MSVRKGLSADRVVVAAAELADDVGLAEVTLSTLARRFEVKPASLYSHVAGSDDLRTRVALLALAELADHAADAVAGRAGGDALRAIADVHREYAATHPGRYDAARLRLDAATAASSAGPRLAAMMRAALAGYRLGEPDETHAVRLVGSVVHGFVDLERSGGFDHSAPTSEETWHRVLDSLDATFAGWSAS
ncbi:TetR-like C-terminal domain-containing protein [Nocardioides sp. SOB77]|uniref:TetR-like C-terminal domain-containing protein n=1 Tax=Nocardioides oceani TaxID=3058369 RepID=A0ABT8FLG9_9ACTN|nr:TetR-like C-terminal domain-containing protein [Nocardioides oceani]MDN4175320.1 TetR-like C-terminal domain-containing protein [Nocardioides oceani]